MQNYLCINYSTQLNTQTMEDINVTWCVFIRRYCDVLGSDRWEFEEGKSTRIDAMVVARNKVIAGETVKIEEVFHTGKYPNL